MVLWWDQNWDDISLFQDQIPKIRFFFTLLSVIQIAAIYNGPHLIDSKETWNRSIDWSAVIFSERFGFTLSGSQYPLIDDQYMLPFESDDTYPTPNPTPRPGCTDVVLLGWMSDVLFLALSTSCSLVQTCITLSPPVLNQVFSFDSLLYSPFASQNVCVWDIYIHTHTFLCPWKCQITLFSHPWKVSP